MKTINYKGKGEHSVNELELIIGEQAEELHLLKSQQKKTPINCIDFCLDEDEISDLVNDWISGFKNINARTKINLEFGFREGVYKIKEILISAKNH